MLRGARRRAGRSSTRSTRAPCARPSCAARPDVVVHQLTALAGLGMSRNFDRAFAATNRLRTEGTDHLIAAARAAGARRLVWQSYAGWPYAREGGAGQDRGRPARPRAAGRRARVARRDPLPGGGGDGRRRARGRGAALRRLLRADDVDRRGRRAPRADPQAQVPDRRRRRRRVVVRAHRRRGGGDRRGDRGRRDRHLQRRRRRSRRRRASGCPALAAAVDAQAAAAAARPGSSGSPPARRRCR